MSGRVSAPTSKPLWKVPKSEKPVKVAIKQVGKVGKAWDIFRKQYLKSHPPDWLDNYVCAMGGHTIHKSQVTLDHIKPRGSHPELRYDEKNIQILCPKHHIQKDSGFNYGRADGMGGSGSDSI